MSESSVGNHWSDHIEYEVETIVDCKVHEGNKYYYIKWKGFPDSDNTWEPISHLKGCEKIVARFEKKLQKSLPTDDAPNTLKRWFKSGSNADRNSPLPLPRKNQDLTIEMHSSSEVSDSKQLPLSIPNKKAANEDQVSSIECSERSLGGKSTSLMIDEEDSDLTLHTPNFNADLANNPLESQTFNSHRHGPPKVNSKSSDAHLSKVLNMSDSGITVVSDPPEPSPTFQVMRRLVVDGVALFKVQNVITKREQLMSRGQLLVADPVCLVLYYEKHIVT